MPKKPLAFVIAAVFSFLLTSLAVSEVGKTDAKKAAVKDDLYSKIELFTYALTTIQSDYVDEKTPKDLIYGSLKGMLSSLDPHSQFLDPEDYKSLKTETEGRFGGVGIEITLKDGLLTIITPIEDTPAWKAGIKPGDHIMRIDKDITRDITLDDAVKKLRGNPGTKVRLTIMRDKPTVVIKDYEITREIIHVKDIKAPHIIDDHIGYVRLSEFREESYKQFHEALKKLRQDGADSLIVDLRNNPGGLLNVAIRMSEDFLPSGKVIVSIKGRHPEQATVAKSSNGNGEFLNWPMVVLINEGSASASEIFAGAMKDNKRAITVGMKSFGKGSVQSVIPLPDGSGLRLTTAKYFTPSGVCIHGIGITPDVTVEAAELSKNDKDDESKKDKGKDLDKMFADVEKQESKEPMDDQKTKELEQKKKDSADNQLQTAVNVIKGIRVYSTFQNP